MRREVKVVNAGGASKRSLMIAAAVAVAIGSSLAVASSCGGNQSASEPDSTRTTNYAFAGTWTFSPTKPVVSCKGAPLEASDLGGKKVVIVSTGTGSIAYQDSGCSVPMTVHGTTATSGGSPTACPAAPSGLSSTIRSIDLSAQGPDTLSVKIQGDIKGGGYECATTITGELNRA